MSTGYQHTIKIHEDSTGTVVLDSFARKAFTHDSSFTASSTSVVKNDFVNDGNDAYTVQVSYPTGDEPATSTSLANLLTTAKDAVNNKYGDGEAGDATA